MTVGFYPSAKTVEPQLTLGHILKLRAGWVDDHTFALVYDTLDQRRFSSPVYPDGQATNRIELITCNARQLDCRSLLHRINPAHSMAMDQFPEGEWPSARETSD